MKITLPGHVSPETAYVVNDYPYGFRLRCKARYWIETHPKRGQRVMFQTTNPKIEGREVWNRAKASTYNTLHVLVLNESNHHVEVEGLGYNATEAQIQAFATQHAPALTGAYEQEAIKRLIAWDRAQSKVTWKVTSGADAEGKPHQTMEEQVAIMSDLAAKERKKMD